MMMTSQKRKNIYINVSFFKSLRGEANKAIGIRWKKEGRDVSSTPHSFVVLTQWSIVNIS